MSQSPPFGPSDSLPMARPVPKCLTCGYALHGLPEPRCPECGRDFDPNDPSTYTLKPPFARWRYWMPGFLLAFGGGLAVYAFAAAASGFGWATTIALPLCVGALLGYGVRVRWVVLPLLGLILLAGIILGLVSLSFVGVYCGLILAGIALGPLLIGTFIGWVLREILKRSRFDQRWHLPTICFLILPMILAWTDRVTWTQPPAEAVQTVAVINVTADDAWRRVRFYEQVNAGDRFEEPAIFRWRWLGLPRPIYSSGSAARPGDRTVCVYDKGRLVKQVTAVEETPTSVGPQRRLAFRVMEQGFERHAMRLEGGSFTLEPVDAVHTRVTLETTYIAHLRPRWCWRSSEQWTVHELHGYVIRGLKFEPERQVATANADAIFDESAADSGGGNAMAGVVR